MCAGEVLLGDLARAGFDITRDHEDADAIVVNTCAFVEVRGPAAAESAAEAQPAAASAAAAAYSHSGGSGGGGGGEVAAYAHSTQLTTCLNMLGLAVGGQP